MLSSNADYYALLSRNVRKKILELIFRTKSPHLGSSFSIVEILVALYFKVLNIKPEDPFYSDRDRFILSKGHGCPALYSILEERGFISEKEILGFAINNGVFEQHPNIDIKRGIEATTGSLGHGLSIGVGMALAAMKDSKAYKVYVLLSDGELNEGSVWEAAMFAAHYGLGNLVAVVDNNGLQIDGPITEVCSPEPITDKFAAFGWHVITMDAHDFDSIDAAFEEASKVTDKPVAIIQKSTKGKGVSFMENQVGWHGTAPNKEQYDQAMSELSAQLKELED